MMKIFMLMALVAVAKAMDHEDSDEDTHEDMTDTGRIFGVGRLSAGCLTKFQECISISPLSGSCFDQLIDCDNTVTVTVGGTKGTKTGAATGTKTGGATGTKTGGAAGTKAGGAAGTKDGRTKAGDNQSRDQSRRQDQSRTKAGGAAGTKADLKLHDRVNETISARQNQD
nr:P17/29C-like protein DDB_G0287399 [Penaeus vannamei]